MIQTWKFVYRGGDGSTHLNTLAIYSNGKLAYYCGIELNESEGLQTGNYGWVNPVEQGTLFQAIYQFKPVYWPIVILD